jgi:PKD repeat protein
MARRTVFFLFAFVTLASGSLTFGAAGHPPARESSPPSWSLVGPTTYLNQNGDAISGRATSLWSPQGTPSTIYLGTAGGGVWKTVNGGTTWAPIFDGAGPQGIGAVAGDPSNPHVLYVGTGEGNFNDDALPGLGLFKSTDGGASWTHIELPDMWGPYRSPIRKIVVDPRDSSRVYAGASNGLYFSLDAGATWNLTRMGSSTYYTVCTDIALDSVHPAAGQPSAVYVAVGLLWGETSNGIYRSLGGGPGPWTKITVAPAGAGFPDNPGRIALASAPSDPKRLYALVHQAGGVISGLYSAADGAADPVVWTQKNPVSDLCSNQCWYDLALAVHPTDASRLILGGLDAWASIDAGATLTKISDGSGSGANYAHSGHHALLLSGTTLSAATDGGVFAANLDWGGPTATWSHRNAGLPTLQILSLAQHPTDPAQMLASAKNNGLAFGNGSTWTQVYPGNPGEVLWDTDPSFAYCEGPGALTLRNSNFGADPTAWTCIRHFGGADCSGSTQVDNGKVADVAPMVLDPNPSPGGLLTAGSHVYRNALPRTGDSWSDLAGELIPADRFDYLTALHAALNGGTPGILYAGAASGHVYSTVDGGAHWLETSPDNTGTRVTSIVTLPSDGRKVLLTFAEYWGHRQVFRSMDAGATWLDVTGPLPYGSCWTLALDPADPNRAFVGTDHGAYENRDVWNGNGWISISANMPEAAVTRLAFGTGGRLRAATYGRAIWELPAVPACAGALSPTRLEPGPEGGSVPVNVDVPAGCTWTTSSPFSWVTFVPSAGTGPGTVEVTVAPSSDTGERSVRVFVAGQVLQVDQAGGCSYGLSPTQAQFGAEGGTGTVTVATGETCAWSAASAEPWVTLQTLSGTGPGSVAYTVAPNGTPSGRTGMLTVAGKTFLVSEEGQCTTGIDPPNAQFAAAGGTATVTVTAPESCSWNATSMVPWIEITAGATGTGSGSVAYTVAANGSANSRTGSLTIAGSTFAVTQEGGCSYAIDPTGSSYGVSGGTGRFGVTALAGCAWSAQTADTWITFDQSASGTGDGEIRFTVAPNPSSDPRTGSIHVAGWTHNVYQYGNACSLNCFATVAACGLPGLALSFTSSVTSTGCTAEPVFQWSFGDGQNSSDQNPTHTYAAAGTYNWSLLVTLGGTTCVRTGLVNVVPHVPGDCDGDAMVSIGEVQKAINMFLGILPVGCGVDCNGSGQVSIGEVQKVINAFLGVTCGCG